MTESMQRIYANNEDDKLVDTEIHNHESRCGEIKYIDGTSVSRVERVGFDVDESLFGGARKKNKRVTVKKMKKPMKRRRESEVKPLFRSLVDVPDSDIQEFISKFKLGYIAASPKSNAIFIIPNSTAMKVLELDLKEKVKAPDTPEGVEEIKNGDLLYKRYILDVYGGNENEGYEYRIPIDYPDQIDEIIRRRQSRAGIPLFIKLSSKGISVSENSDMSNPVECKFRMKIGNDAKYAAYVFEGNLSFDTVEKAKKINNLNKFKQLLRTNFNDYESAAYKFIGTMAKNHGISEIQPFYSANLVHTSLGLIHKFGAKEEFEDFNMDEDEVDEINEELVKNYKLSKPIYNYSQLCERMSLFNTQCFERNMSSNQHISNLSDQYSKVYSKLGLAYNEGDLATDVGYGIYNQTHDLDLAMEAMAETDSLMKGGEVNPLMYHAIIDAIDEFSFTGANAHQYMPITYGLRNRKSKSKVSNKKGGVKTEKKLKKTKTKTKRMGEDEEIEINDNDLEFEGGDMDEEMDEKNGDGDDFDLDSYI